MIENTADGFGDWSSRGCALVNETEEGVVCECDHLINFAILLVSYSTWYQYYFYICLNDFIYTLL